MSWRCCTIVASGDMSLLLLDLATGDARPLGSPSNFQSVRWASDGRSLLALTDLGGGDFMRLRGWIRRPARSSRGL